MADPALDLARPASDPGERGRLDIAQRVVERIATYAASEVAGVTSVGSTLERAVGRQYPKASAQVAGRRASVSLDIAIAWPAPLAQVTQSVRSAVRERLHELAGLEVDAVDVTAAKIVHVQPEQPRRVR